MNQSNHKNFIIVVLSLIINLVIIGRANRAYCGLPGMA